MSITRRNVKLLSYKKKLDFKFDKIFNDPINYLSIRRKQIFEYTVKQMNENNYRFNLVFTVRKYMIISIILGGKKWKTKL